MNQRSNAPQTLAWQPLDSEQILACPRVPVWSVLQILPEKYILAIQQNAPNACCHEVATMDVEAWFSSPAEKAKGTPDVYKFYCKTCERCHVRFCLGGNHPVDPDRKDIRPFWEAR